jgi:hypothetical protein
MYLMLKMMASLVAAVVNTGTQNRNMMLNLLVLKVI